MHTKTSLIAAVALLTAVALIQDASAQVPLEARSGKSIADVTAKALPSVVNISTTKAVKRARSPYRSDPFFRNPFGRDRRSRKRYARSLGSGVIISTQGYVLTNNHVIANATKIRIKLSNGRKMTAKLVGADPKSDLAVLKLQGRLPKLTPVTWGNSARMRLGEVVLAIGNPFGVGQTVTMGIVSAKGRANVGIVDYEDFIQTDAAINPGNSGGALINMRGELIGINTAMLSKTGGYQGIGFAIPSNMAKPIMKSLISKGRVDRGWLGVSIQTYDNTMARGLNLGNVRGVLVADVLAGSPAQRAGLRRNDIILALNGVRVTDAGRFRNLIAMAGAGRNIALDLYRDRRRMKGVRVALGKLPGKRGVVATKRAPVGQAAPGGMLVKRIDNRARRRYNLPRNLSYGVVVTSVARGGAASQIGLRAGDVILEVNRRKVRSAAGFKREYRNAGSTLVLLIYRDGSTVYIALSK